MKKLCSIVVAAVLLIGCAGSKVLKSVDDGMTKFQNESAKLNADGILSATGTDISKDLQIAIDKAKLIARTEIANEIAIEIKNYEKRAISDAEAGTEELLKTYRQATELIAIQTLRGCTVKDVSYVKEDGNYRAFILMMLDHKLFDQYFKDEINSKEILRAKFEEKKIFDEAEPKWKQYKEENKN
jgi:uncharacterized protein YcfL